MIGGVLIAS